MAAEDPQKHPQPLPHAQRPRSASGARENGGNGLENIRVLMYHRITEDEPCTSMAQRYCLDYRAFESQLKFLDRQGFSAVTFEDVHLNMKGELPLPRRPVIITFDDGYEDTYELAYPLLMEYGMKAVVFALGDRSIRENRWDVAPDAPPVPLMSDSQILEIYGAGFEIGSHSLTHPRLPEISRDAAWEEISRSRMLLEILINSPVRTFSYPFGLHDADVRRMAAEAGYEFACGVYTGAGSFDKDLYDIRRIHPASDAMGIGFAVQMMTPYQKYSAMKWKVRQAFSRRGAHKGTP